MVHVAIVEMSEAKIETFRHWSEGGGVIGGQKRKICPFLNQSIENEKLYNISKNEPCKSIRRGDTRISPLFDLEIVLFLPYLPSKLG